ncbi:hypothetical protein GRF56_16730 [Aeromonas veronii]|nr:hypothetical protein GRF56_16730 [Aeromonas veronii]
MKNADMPAMPVRDTDNEPLRIGLYPVYSSGEFATGLTKREMMAMHIMASIATTVGYQNYGQMAEDAVAATDALLAELEKVQP